MRWKYGEWQAHKETVMSYLKVLTWHSDVETEENQGHFNNNSRLLVSQYSQKVLELYHQSICKAILLQRSTDVELTTSQI
jgi:hypothetical protein